MHELLQGHRSLQGLPDAARAAARAVRRVVRRWRRATPRRSWDRRAAARARCSTSSARSSRRRPARVTLDGRNPVPARRRRDLAAFRNDADRLRLPGSLPAAAVHGARERADPDAGRAEPPRADEADARAASLIEQVGLARPHRSSPGRAVGRRAAARRDRARAGPRQPRLLLCDEPTGNLDRAAADNVAVRAARSAPPADRPS